MSVLTSIIVSAWITRVTPEVTTSEPSHRLRHVRSRASAHSQPAPAIAGARTPTWRVSAMNTDAAPSHTRLALPIRRSIGRFATMTAASPMASVSVPAHANSVIVAVTLNAPATITAIAGPYSRCSTRAVAHRNSTVPSTGIAIDPPDRPHRRMNGIDSTGYRSRVRTICQVGSLSAKYQGARCVDGDICCSAWIAWGQEYPMSRAIIVR